MRRVPVSTASSLKNIPDLFDTDSDEFSGEAENEPQKGQPEREKVEYQKNPV